jgi:hypothetical protein
MLHLVVHGAVVILPSLTIGTSGVLNGVSVGSVTITYTLGGAYVTYNDTVVSSGSSLSIVVAGSCYYLPGSKYKFIGVGCDQLYMVSCNRIISYYRRFCCGQSYHYYYLYSFRYRWFQAIPVVQQKL